MLAVLMMAPFLAQADVTIVNVATPGISAGLGASAAAVELVVGGYLVTYAVLLITGARLGQTHGYRRMFLLGVAAFGACSLVAGLAPNAPVLVAARVVQGIGAALMYPQALTSIQLHFTGSARARAVSLFALAQAGGAVCGQILGGALVAADIGGTGWRAIFLINVPICAITLGAALLYLPAGDNSGKRQLDLAGVATLSVSLLLIVAPLIIGRGYGWPAWTWVCLAVSVPAFRGFVATQRRAERRTNKPLISLQLLIRPTIAWGLVGLATSTGTYYALLFTLAQFLQRGLGRGALFSGLALLPWVIAFGLAGQLTRRLPTRAARHLPAASYLLMATVYVALSVSVLSEALSDGLLLVLLCLGGLGLGGGFNALIGRLADAAPARHAPDISGVVTTTLQIGGAIGVAAFGSAYLTLAAQPAQAFAVTSLALATTAFVAATAASLCSRYQHDQA